MDPERNEARQPADAPGNPPRRRPACVRGAGGKARYRASLFNLAPDGYLVTDRAGTIRLANRVASLFLGVERRALAGLSLFDLLPDEGARLREQLRELEAAPGPAFRVREWHARMRKGNGETFFAALTVTVVNRPRELHWGLRDVTERRRLENELRHSEARLRAILAGAFNGMLTVDPAGTVRSLNPMAERLFGYTADEATGRDVALLLPSLEGEGGERLRRLAATAGIGAGLAHEAVALRKDGTMLVADLSVTEVRLDDERFYSIIVRDVTAQKRAGEELRASEARLRRLVESNIIGIVFSDPAGRLTGANDAFLRLAGYARDDLEAGRLHWRNLTAPEHRSRDERAVEELQRAGVCTPYETECLRRDGGRVPVLIGAATLDDGRGEAVAFILDLTELRAARERAFQAERLAAIGQTMTGLAHESRNAFQRSQAALERLRRRVDDRPEVRELLGELQQAQDHLHFLYEEVRSYAAPIKLDLEEVDLAEVWREAWRHLAVRREGRQVELREELDGSGTRVRADARRVGQVFRNVLENALDASPDPGVIRVRCAATESAGPGTLTVAVCDGGPGFSPAQRQRLFEPFFTTKTRGTGLGMAIARRIVEAHGGRIEIGPGLCPGAEVLITLTRRGP